MSEPNPSVKKVIKKSGRTLEQQAARDARKAAKVAITAPDGAPAESSTSIPVDPSSPLRKRRRSSGSQSEAEDDPNLLEIDPDAPTPLSKAEARAARKKVKKGEEVEPKVDKKEPVEPKRKNSIWIGNLSFKTTPTSLKDFLQKGVSELGGEVECVTRVNLPTKAGKGAYVENKGFAYVDFATPELQAMALKLSEKPFEGRRVLIKLGDDHNPTLTARTPKPPSIIAGTLPKKHKHGESSTLFVGNLPFDATEQGLRDLVETNAVGLAEPENADSEGEDEAEKDAEKAPSRGGKRSGLKKVRLGAFEDTGRCKGFAFLDFHTPLLAKVALANRKNHFYNGRKLNVEFASEEATKRAGGRSAPKPSDPSKPIRTQGAFVQKNVAAEHEEADVTEEQLPLPRAARPAKTDTRGKKWEATGRPRPGAALAMAKREKVGIVEGEGQKIVFD